MSNDKMRESFEVLVKMPLGIYWDGNRYAPDHNKYIHESGESSLKDEMNAADMQARFEGYCLALSKPSAQVPDGLLQSITDRIVDWCYCGLSTNGHTNSPEIMEEFHRFRLAVVRARKTAPSIAERPDELEKLRTENAELKQWCRQCKVCKTEFPPWSTTQKVCGVKCAQTLASEKREPKS